jgi:uncharacterized protein
VTDAAEVAWIDKLRQSGIRVDREGRFIHEGAEVTHQGLRSALFRWLDRLPAPERRDGSEAPDRRYILRLDARRFAYLDVDDTPLVVRSARVDPEGIIQLALSDGAEEPLDPTTLTVDEAGILRAWVRGGRLEARLSSSAVAALTDRLTESDGQPALSVAGRPVPLRARPAR